MLAPLALPQQRSPFALASLFNPIGPPARPGAPSALPIAPKPSGAPTDVLQVSDLARQLFAQAQAAQANQTSTFDLHLDLDEAALRVGAAGTYDAQARHLTLDLHVTSRAGTMKVDGREVQFQELQISMSMTREEASISAGAGDVQGTRRALGDQLGRLVNVLAGHAEDEGGGPKNLLFNSLKELTDLLGPKAGPLLAMLRQIAELVAGLAMGDQKGGSPPPLALPPSIPAIGQELEGQVEYQRETMQLEVHSVSLAWGGPAQPEAAGQKVDAIA